MGMGNKKSILIIGGSGYLGRKLAAYLVKKDYKVTILSRKKIDLPGVTYCIWNPENGLIDTYCLKNIDVIVNFAGNGIADKLWTKKRKADIINSRVNPLTYLFNSYLDIENKPKKIISASAVGYYGHRQGEELSEKCGPGKGFLPQVCVAWETAANNFKELGCKVIITRIGVVIAPDSGFVTNIKRSPKFGINIIPGSGEQTLPWISLQDFLRSYVYLIEQTESSGTYNLSSPEYYNLEKIQTNIVSKKMKSIHFPKNLIRILAQDFSEIFLNDIKVLPERLLSEGFRFKDKHIEDCI